MEGIRDGFRIGFNRSELGRERLSSAKKNMYSVVDNAHVVSDYLEAEMSRGAVLGPFAPDAVPGVQIN